VQVQRWLGHHPASFTLDTYVHLLDGDIGEPLLARVNTGSTACMQNDANEVSGRRSDSALQREAVGPMQLAATADKGS
jgi:hypothetical protein